MKKIYLLAFLILLNIDLYSENSAEATMKIRLKLLQPIKVSCEDMNFGRVVSGQSYEAYSTVQINCEPFSLIDIELESKTKSENGVNLLEPLSNRILEVKLNSVGEYATRVNIYELENAPLRMPYDGNLKLKIKGKLDIPYNQQSGDYKGVLVFKVRYN